MATETLSYFGIPNAAIGPITAAVIAGIVGLITLVITKEQKTSEFRQAWIDCVRNDIASYISAINALRDIDRIDIKDPKLQWETAGPMFDQANQALMRVKLRLNPEELPSAEIVDIMEKLSKEFCLGTEPNGPRIDGLEVTLITKSQRVLKAEWDRVRKGEPAFKAAKWTTIALVVSIVLAFLLRFSLAVR